MKRSEVIRINETQYALIVWDGNRRVAVRMTMRDGYISLDLGGVRAWGDEDMIVVSSAGDYDGLIRHVLQEADLTYPDPNPAVTSDPRWREMSRQMAL
jgi:hypothetical protein